MKKKFLLKSIGFMLLIAAAVSILGAVFVTGSGFLDVSNIARGTCIGIAIICGILAALALIYSKPNEGK